MEESPSSDSAGKSELITPLHGKRSKSMRRTQNRLTASRRRLQKNPL
jgi:hypothetical protein